MPVCAARTSNANSREPFAGLFLAQALGYGNQWFFVLITQIFIAVILVAITAALFRKSST